MNDFLKQIARLVIDLNTANGIESIMIVDDMERLYNELICNVKAETLEKAKEENILTFKISGQDLLASLKDAKNENY